MVDVIDSTGAPPVSIPADQLETLANRERRRVVRTLVEHEETVGKTTLAKRLVERVSTADTLEDLQIRLVHVHLPALAEADLVEWDRAGNAIRPTRTAIDVFDDAVGFRSP